MLRAIDAVLHFPDLRNFKKDVAILLQVLAEFWVAYYWPFCNPQEPILQGQRAVKKNLDEPAQDIDFRPLLTRLKLEWEHFIKKAARPSDGFVLLTDMHLARKRETYPASLQQTYTRTINTIVKTIENPIQYAGSGEWTVFDRPAKLKDLPFDIVSVPGTNLTDKCLVVKADLWQTFRELSLWVEALCLHEWCLFTERINKNTGGSMVERGRVYNLLTDRPGNRRPLDWERNQVDLLLLEGKEFICPWTEKRILLGTKYDLDHLLPLAIYPVNELWNLVPADPEFNSHVKRDRLPSIARLDKAAPFLTGSYENYEASKPLSRAIEDDALGRFTTVKLGQEFPQKLTAAVKDFLNEIASSRNFAQCWKSISKALPQLR